jgi:hypothetical protein
MLRRSTEGLALQGLLLYEFVEVLIAIYIIQEIVNDVSHPSRAA